MNLQKFTQKSIEAVNSARDTMVEYGNQQMRQEHILYALLMQEDGLISEMVSKLGADKNQLAKQTEEEIDKLPKVSGSGVDPERIYISGELDQAFSEAEHQAEKMKDEYVSVEHIMLGLLGKPQDNIKKLLSAAGITTGKFLNAGQSWGTKALLGEHPLDFELVEMKNQIILKN